MNQRTTAFLSLLLTFAITLSSVSFSFARVEEGMYTPDQIAKLPLKKKGLKISPEEIYNPNGGGLSEAIVQLSVGCTAEFVSPDGLILTNHHCGHDGLVSASSPGNDLVDKGFKADNRAGEIPAKGYSVFVTQRVEDVTAKVRLGTDNLTGEALAAAIAKNTEALKAAEEAKAPKGSTIRIQSLNSGYFHYLYQRIEIKDVRLVYAPPNMIGFYGGDPDNFEWTRHTGDFTFLRAYTAPDGTSAEYSPNNIPFKPKKHLTINIGGLKDDDFVFVMGYPGSTTRYRESQAIERARDAEFPFLSAWLDARSAGLRLSGETDEKKRIEYQSMIANFDNYRKVYKGSAEKFVKADVVAKRQAEEAQFAAWINADPVRQQKYGTVLAELKKASDETYVNSKRDVILSRFPGNSTTPVLMAIYNMVASGKALSDAEREAKKAELEKTWATRDAIYEREMIKFNLKQLADLPNGQKLEPAESLFGSLQGAARREPEAEFASNVAEKYWPDAAKIAAINGPQTMEIRPERDNVIAFVRGLVKEKKDLTARTESFNAKIDRLRLLFQQGMAEMKGITPYPDANSTLRFTYGNIRGYSPRESHFYTPFTTLKGMIAKDTGVFPFDAPEKLRDLQRAKDFGRYGEADSVIVNLLATTDIIGGNSGSPMLNGKGEQIGLVFDGNYEGLGNDMYYDPAVGRTIAVDIRYVLFVTEKFGDAKWVVDEMTIVGGTKAKAAGN